MSPRGGKENSICAQEQGMVLSQLSRKGSLLSVGREGSFAM
jgi:hypothetical protein